jgi:hypothetical protein
MRLYNVHGKLQSKKVSKYLINWDAKSKSNIQFKTKQFLKPYWQNHIVYEEFPVYGTRMKVDIVNATRKIAIEVNGPQHNKFNKFFHNNSRAKYLESIKRDVKKREWLELNNFKTIEIEQNEVKSLTKKWFEKEFDIIL